MSDPQPPVGVVREARYGLFARLYNWMLRVSRHRHARFWLGTVSFAESSFFPIPPDVMLAPMTLARPDHWWRLALLTTVTSVLGGLLGYVIGLAMMEAAMPWVEAAGYRPAYEQAASWFEDWGFWAIFLAGFTPIPFKVFTVAAGSVGLALPVFVIGALVGRGLRFMAVAGVVRLLGPAATPWLERHLERIGWLLVLATIIAALVLGLRG
ncbi:DedA family protein [Algiphilus sp. NNCM1]|uniref:YqaA family protein n=1 Tax=Algiphilus sp. TaxID=1872431 RepID=UPI001CA680C6|nr:YqaA family protein [Algiphilus sp.]MBY8965331.1 DedA family protein [Algiphilus acroporae]MCI5061421.1 DedA family protein [Algiphilus sp.]MCI5104047.1 DedA family protein [Algiphilus sp.]